MATLPTQSFTTIVANTITGIQGRASKLINFATGSTLRAIVEGFGGLFLWFQAMVLQLLQACRLSTASGADVDTFTADFMPIIGTSNGVPSPRLGAEAATGQLTFARFTAAPSSCFIPAAKSVSATGVIVNAGPSPAATAQSADGSVNFVVIADVTNPAYSSTLGGFTLAADLSSIVVAAQAEIAGAAGNVAFGTVTNMTSTVVGIDTVTNATAFVNGADQESDSSLKTRFSAYILGLSRGDYYGLNSAILGTDITVQWTLLEDYDFGGNWHPATFFVVADDGSGNPPASFMTAVTNAANSVRPLGVQCSVFPPTVIQASVSMQITTGPNYAHNEVVAQVAAVVGQNINALGLGVSLPYSILASWAYTVPGVVSVQSVFLNGLQGDAASINAYRMTLDNLTKIFDQTIKTYSIVVS